MVAVVIFQLCPFGDSTFLLAILQEKIKVRGAGEYVVTEEPGLTDHLSSLSDRRYLPKGHNWKAAVQYVPARGFHRENALDPGRESNPLPPVVYLKWWQCFVFPHLVRDSILCGPIRPCTVSFVCPPDCLERPRYR